MNKAGKLIDVISIDGHATYDLMEINGYKFRRSPEEVGCLAKYISPNAQVFLLGCNTATAKPDGEQNLTERLSTGLPGRETVGYSAFYNPLTTVTTFSNGRFTHENYSLLGHKSAVIKNTPS